MTKKAYKSKKCNVCRKEYTPISGFQKACSPKCAIEYNRIADRKALNRGIAKWKKDNKSSSKLMKEAQKAFNTYIRVRDLYMPCISCCVGYHQIHSEQGWKVGGAWDAGHYKSRGAKPQLRFNTYNCHKQCKKCNGGSGKYTHKDVSTSKKYELNLIDKIGQKKVDWLNNNNDHVNFSDEYLIRIKKIFNKKSRLLKKRHGIA